MEEKRDSMIFYRSFYEAVKELSKEQQGEIYNAIFCYGLDFTEPILSGISKTVWTLIKPQIDANIKRYNNGKKTKQKQNESKTEAKQKLESSKTEANVNVNVNVNDNDININDIISFDWFWNTYDKKVDRTKCEAKFKKLSFQEKEKIKEVLPAYIKTKSDIQFRKNPLTWLNGKCWNDEIEAPANNNILTQKSIDEFDWDSVGLGSILPNGAIITPDVVHIHEATGLSYRKLSSL